ncbi:hypothetical protein [Candidiatus Paracoxiella cheracis]|uniref:hypothetical protein n=1 Tax=Candidiatus Paracoxiella cheracis TaxID=3405120 RepID=UPI003BF53853
MSKFVRVLLVVLIIAAVGYAFAFKNGRVRNNFSQASNDSNSSSGTQAVLQGRACTQLGAIKNQSSDKKTFSFSAKALSMHTKVASFPARLEPGMSGQYELLLPCAEGSEADKITVEVSSNSTTSCTYTLMSDGNGGAKISSTDASMCSWDSSGDLMIGGSGDTTNSGSTGNTED